MIFIQSKGMRIFALMTSIGALSACDTSGFDFDFRGNKYDTSDAALKATAKRPQADDRGVISYPNYQVAVARRGDTLQSLSDRLGVDAVSVGNYNGIEPNEKLRAGEVIALPSRVSEPSPATGAATSGPLRPNEDIDISELAGAAIDQAGETPTKETPKAPTAPKEVSKEEPIRHKVKRGESAYTIARLYGVSVRSLADWNGLGSDFKIREGQYLLIPVALARPENVKQEVAAPGKGSATPIPPSASTPLPTTVEKPTKVVEKPIATPKGGKFGYPVSGSIIREYAKGKNDGVDFAAAAGTKIKAAEAGSIAAITSDADQVPIIVVKHANNILTVYANVADIKVSKGATVNRGTVLGVVPSGSPSYMHFEVREGFESVDPMSYLK